MGGGDKLMVAETTKTYFRFPGSALWNTESHAEVVNLKIKRLEW